MQKDDVIYRQAAIEALESIGSLDTDADREYARGIFNALPPVQPERKKGRWIDYTDDGYVECPFCHSATNCDDNKDELHFCFSCGADMRGEQNED